MKEIITALVKARQKIESPKKDGKGHFGRYLTYDSLISAVVPALNEEGIFVSQTVSSEEGGQTALTRLLHISGECLETRYPIVMPTDTDNPCHGIGIATTYAFRRGLAHALGVAGEEDSDGEHPRRQDDRSPRKSVKIEENVTESQATWIENAIHPDHVKKILEEEGITSLRQLRASRFPKVHARVTAWLQSKAEQAAKQSVEVGA